MLATSYTTLFPETSATLEAAGLSIADVVPGVVSDVAGWFKALLDLIL